MFQSNYSYPENCGALRFDALTAEQMSEIDRILERDRLAT